MTDLAKEELDAEKLMLSSCSAGEDSSVYGLLRVNQSI